ncbi:MAG TPA: DUF4097 family beta strand repeat-containing protein [Blastocatellia bacterium]|nr:DUF4097 family beta strand repeat-containing protein [Blastocatellia bacterium]
MAVHCDNCGAEMLPGHRFCRSCGRPADEYAEEGTPTQMMPPEPPTRGPRDTATTSPSRGETNRVYTPPEQNYYQPPYAPIQPPQQQVPYYAQPPRSRTPWGWIIAVIVLCLMGAFGVLALIFSNANDRPGPGRPTAGAPDVPRPPDAPTPPGVPVPPGSEETVNGGGFTRTFPLASGATIDLNTIQGNVRIVGWDQQQAEVTTKSGNADVRIRNTGNGLSLNTDPRLGNISVDYEIKLPRNVKLVQINSATADVELSGLNSEVVVKAGTGSVELTGINGRIDIKAGTGDVTISNAKGEMSIECGTGDISTAFSGEIRGPVRINAGQGDVDLQFGSGVNADFEASTTNGDIDFDGAFDISVRETRPGKQATGRIGSGGPRVSVTATAGDISATRK